MNKHSEKVSKWKDNYKQDKKKKRTEKHLNAVCFSFWYISWFKIWKQKNYFLQDIWLLAPGSQLFHSWVVGSLKMDDYTGQINSTAIYVSSVLKLTNGQTRMVGEGD